MLGLIGDIARLRLLRAALAMVFVALLASQPGLFATANAAGAHDQTAVENASHQHDHQLSKHDAPQSGQMADAVDHHGVGKGDGKSCEVHCAPAHAMPVDCPPVPQPASGGFQSAECAAPLFSVADEVVQPPRT
ncbi:MAG: hypothetical protein K5872_11725 [Rhizobiaceae bacterium]|nr:hypothetical protein [Rhizobiaceae bacterium]MCV0406885.1 hypothetical protein [Rhizobiaceae bacterium]